MQVTINLEDFISKLAKLNSTKICKHSIMVDLLAKAQEQGEIISDELIRACVENDDYVILKILSGSKSDATCPKCGGSFFNYDPQLGYSFCHYKNCTHNNKGE